MNFLIGLMCVIGGVLVCGLLLVIIANLRWWVAGCAFAFNLCVIIWHYPNPARWEFLQWGYVVMVPLLFLAAGTCLASAEGQDEDVYITTGGPDSGGFTTRRETQNFPRGLGMLLTLVAVPCEYSILAVAGCHKVCGLQ
jgi:hypothetical protein